VGELGLVLIRHSLRDPAAGSHAGSRTVAEEARRRGYQVDVNPRRVPHRGSQLAPIRRRAILQRRVPSAERGAQVSTYPAGFQNPPRVSCPVPLRHPYDQSNPLTFADHDFVLAEQHLLAAGKRDAAKLLAEMMFEWCVRFTTSCAAPPGTSSLGGCLCRF
jgi:hypothetical protein